MSLWMEELEDLVSRHESNIEYADPHITQNPITAAYPAGIGLLGGLKAIAVLWNPW